jgi:hypothetical protein
MTDPVLNPFGEPLDEPGPDKGGPDKAARDKAPFYPRLLRLKNIHPNAVARALLGEGMAALGFLASPGGVDIAPFWAIVVLPVAMAGVVKAHDVLAGFLRPIPANPVPASPVWPE